MHALSIKWLPTLLIVVLFLSGCASLSSSATEPPRPTIVPATSTLALAESPTTASQAEGQLTDASTTNTDEPLLGSVSQSPPATPTALPAATPTTPPLPPLDSIELKLLPVAEGFTKPLFATTAGDGSGRLFVVEQAGNIHIVKDGAVNPAPFLDIVSIVGSNASEQGLLSVAFHPNYVENGLFFVNYTNKQGDTVIARYQVSDDPDIADPNSATSLLTIGQPYGNHNGGQVTFGPDGYLYIGMGDGGAANDPQNRAQSLDTLLGKILRIDVDNAEPYGVPETNPFVNNDQARPEIWSYGWRNPWRFSFDQATDDMYIADVGQNQYEEVNVEWAEAEPGLNYGWRLMEGFHCFNPSECDPSALDVVLPIAEYDHSLGCSVTGGYVYRGEQFPELEGVYFYGDFCTGIIWGLRYESDDTWSLVELLRTDHQISSFGQDENGEVYLVDHNGSILQMGQ